MRLILEEKFNKRIKNEFTYDFEVLEKGLCAIEISGRAKNWLQNTLRFISFFKDDDLAIKIDGREFPKLSRKRGLFDSEAAWNGNKLKNLSQINLFLIYLDAGKHILQFIADQSPLLETIRIYQAANPIRNIVSNGASEQNVVFEPVKSYQIRSGDRRPWLIFILVDLALERLKIKAGANQKHGDDDDLQLRINGERQINDTPKSHKYWYWCGRVLKGRPRTFDKKLNLAAGLHYIELWADNVPALENVKFVFLGEGKKNGEDVIPYTYKGVGRNEDYNRYDSIIKEVVDYWNNTFLRDTNPPGKTLDPNLVKAVMYQESRVGYYKSEIDVMQVGDPDNPAVRTLRGELKEYWIHNEKQIILEYPDVKIESVRDSIYWGVRWLYHKAQGITADGGRYWLTWKEAVRRYGPSTEEYTDGVWRIYKNGIKKEKNNIIKLWTIGMIILLSLSTFLLWEREMNKINIIKASVSSSFDPRQQLQIQDIEIKFYKNNPSLFLAVAEWEKDWFEELKIGLLKSGTVKWLEIENSPGEQAILSARFINLEGFFSPVLEVYGYGHRGLGTLYLYEIKDDKLLLLFETIAVDTSNESIWRPENYQNYGYTTCGQIYEGGKLSVAYSDINRDGVSDIILKGKADVICDKERLNIVNDEALEDREVKVSEFPINKTYLWNKNNRVFAESI